MRSLTSALPSLPAAFIVQSAMTAEFCVNDTSSLFGLPPGPSGLNGNP